MKNKLLILEYGETNSVWQSNGSQDPSRAEDFINYDKGIVNSSKYFEGSSVSTSLQLGFISFTKTNSSNSETPYLPNGGLSMYSIDIGKTNGIGISTGVNATKMILKNNNLKNKDGK